MRCLTGLGIGHSGTTISSSGQKRKRDDGFVDGRCRMKRSKSDESQTDVTKVDVQGRLLDTEAIHSIEEAKANSLAGRESETYGNRVHYCLVSSPAGRPLHEYRSAKELLEALRDAIAGHRSLLEDGRILHRDISEYNNIITDHAAEGDPKGRLIDLDLAQELDSVQSGASHRTGTMQFMAIEVLQGKGHTYRHDLESTFYVFILICIRYGHEGVGNKEKTGEDTATKRRVRPTKTSILRDWYTGDYKQIANTKRGHMVGFEDITAEFAPEFVSLKDLAEDLRDVLFPIRASFS